MRTILEIIISFCIYSLLQFIPITYEMKTGLGPYGQGNFTLFISNYIVYIYVVIIVVNSILLFILFERNRGNKYRLSHILLLILFLISTMVFLTYKFPYLETDEFIYNNLNGFIVRLWVALDNKVNLINSQEGERALYSIFVKYIFLEEEHVLVSFLSVILAKIYSLIGLINEQIER